jgi:hypothetical protein
MMRTALLISVLVPSLAAAGPSYTVDPAVPFTAHDLAEAVQLRTDARPDVRVTRVGDGLLVEVGDAHQVVDVNAREPHDVARVVALVVVSLVDATPAPVPSPEETPAALTTTAAPAPAPSRWSMRAAVGLSRDDGGTFATPLTGGLSYQLAPFARLAASVTYMKATAPRRDTGVFPFRLGVEGRAGALGVELGAMMIPYSSCGDGADGVGRGGYATGRVYLPLTARTHLLVEAGGYYMLSQAYGCDDTMTLTGEAYGGHVGAGVEARL